MLVYESKVNNEVLSEAQYNELLKTEALENGVSLDEWTKSHDSDFRAYDLSRLNDFGDYSLYSSIEEGNIYNAFYVKYHENVNQHDRLFLVDKKDTQCILQASDDFDDADNADDKFTILSGIEDRLGLN